MRPPLCHDFGVGQARAGQPPKRITDRTVSRRYIFELPENEASLLPVASCVVVKGPESLTDKNGKPIIRPYTPTSASDKEGELEFIIKRYETGLMSKHIHELKPGETLAIKGPIPKIPYKGASMRRSSAQI